MQTAGHGVFNFLQQLFSWHQVFFIWVWRVPLKAPPLVVVGSLHCWAGLEVLVGAVGDRQPSRRTAVALQPALHTGL